MLRRRHQEICLDNVSLRQACPGFLYFVIAGASISAAAGDCALAEEALEYSSSKTYSTGSFPVDTGIPSTTFADASFSMIADVYLYSHIVENVARCVFGHGASDDPQPTNKALQLCFWGDSTLDFGYYNNDLWILGIHVPLKTWMRIAAVHDVRLMQQRVYMDGVLLGKRDITQHFEGMPGENIQLGWTYFQRNMFDGWGEITDVLFYQTALDQADLINCATQTSTSSSTVTMTTSTTVTQTSTLTSSTSLPPFTISQMCQHCICSSGGPWKGQMMQASCAAACWSENFKTFQHASGKKHSGEPGSLHCRCCGSAATQKDYLGGVRTFELLPRGADISFPTDSPGDDFAIIVATVTVAVLLLVSIVVVIMCMKSKNPYLVRSTAQESQELGISALYLTDTFPEEARRAAGKPNPNFYELCDVIAIGENGKGFGKTCPRDGRANCSIVDALELHQRGKATHFVSWCWRYVLDDVVDAIAVWLGSANQQANSPKVSLWMCFFCNNQYRMIEDSTIAGSDQLDKVFERHLDAAGHMLVILDSFLEPHYFTRAWCLFETYVCIHRNIPRSLLLPGQQFREFGEMMGSAGATRVLDKVHQIDVRRAEATVKKDEDKIKRTILNSIGFSKVNRVVRRELGKWMVTAFEEYVNRDDARRSNSGDGV
mmetsp:Transcript_8858/g.21158  ORF Transcript_8858/g.21158 Transcript_8858/m.21158 type:complete len:659 (-) Transcript_8858:209-2185(-)